jgi:hypothetical protein
VKNKVFCIIVIDLAVYFGRLVNSALRSTIQGDSEISLEKKPVIGDDEKSLTKKNSYKSFSFSRYK